MSSRVVEFRPPPCKSALQRALLLALLAGGRTELQLPPGELPEDVRTCLEAVRALGARVERGDACLVVESPGWPARGSAPRRVELRESGTSARMLVALAAYLGGDFEMEADPSLRRRPLGADFVRGAEARGALFTWGERPGHLPLRVRAEAAGPIDLDMELGLSSQSASGALLALARRGGELRLRGPLSYLPLSAAWIEAFGARLDWEETREGARVRAAPGALACDVAASRSFEVPGDASAACFFGAWARGHGVDGRVLGFDRGGLGARHPDRVFDVECARIARGMPGPLELALDEHPDCVAPLAAYATSWRGQVSLRSPKLRHKESDRIAVLAEGLRALGFRARERGDALEIDTTRPREERAPALLRSAGDHRMAMAFAIVGSLHGVAVAIDEPGCVAKSFPGFWGELARWEEERTS